MATVTNGILWLRIPLITLEWLIVYISALLLKKIDVVVLGVGFLKFGVNHGEGYDIF